MANWTAEQLRAITARDKNLLISAGAGSGKTAVLTERIIRLIEEDKIDADKFLVLTFTKAAASEMRRRIRKTLYAKLKAAQDNRDFLYKQMSLLEKAQISTIHSFCLSIIKKYYYVIDTDPASGLLSDAESMLLKQEALEQLFEDKYLEEDEGFIALADMYSPGNDDERFKAIILYFYSFIMNRPDPWTWLETACEQFKADESSFETHPAMIFLLSYIRETIDQCINLINEAKKLCRVYDEDGKRTQYIARLSDDIILLNSMLDRGYDSFLKTLHGFSLPRYDMRSQCEKSDEIKALKDSIKAIIDDLKNSFGFSYETDISHLQQLYLPMIKTAQTVREFAERYTALKRKNSAMDYNDLEQNCLTILKDEQAAEQIKEQYELVFVDEYQDTNSIQEAIVTKVVKKNALFTVGDIKQSIYRFREAEPDLFMRRYQLYKNASDDQSELIFLNTNFRTAPSIIGGINEIFSKIMFTQTGGVDYDPDERMNAGKSAENAFKTEIHIVEYGETVNNFNGSELSENEPFGELLDFKKQEAEAAYTAQLIRRLMTQEIYDESIGLNRKIRPGDIAILGRSMRASAEYFIEALKNAGVTAEYEKSGSYYDEMEVALIIDLLKIIDNMKNDLSLVSVMRSCIFNFNADEMLSIRLFGKEKLYYHEAVSKYALNGDNEVLHAKINAMLSCIESFRESSKHVSIEKLLRNVYNDTKIMAFMSVLSKGKQRQENLKYLLKLASHYENTSFKGLYNFILYVEKCKTHDSSFKINNSSELEDTVKLMTVHKSKGLEFNVVILTGCGNNFNLADTREDIILNKNLGICPTFYDMERSYCCDTIAKTAAKKLISRENTAEEMRIFYVAATRAKQRLLFVGALKTTHAEKLLQPSLVPISPFSIRRCNTYIDWIVQAALTDEDMSELKQNGLVENAYFCTYKRKPKILQKDEAQRNTAASELLASIDTKSADFDEIAKILSYVYPYRISANIPSKFSVSALKNAEVLDFGEKLITMEEAPKFMSVSTEFTNAQIGTFTHTVLMHLDFKSLSPTDMWQDISTQMEILVSKNLLDEREKSAVDISLIMDFLNSDVGKMLSRAEAIHKEQPFILKMEAGKIRPEWQNISETILVQGVIDCFFQIGEKLILIDYKTDHVKNKQQLELLYEKYIKQIDLYDLALEEISGRKADEKYICFLSMKQNLRVD